MELGVIYRDNGRLKEAIPLLEEGYRASKADPTLVDAAPHLLNAYAKSGEVGKFSGLWDEVRKTLPPNSPQLADLLASFGLELLKQQKWAATEPLLRECLTIREKARPDVWSTFNTQSMLGGALLGQKKYAEAEPLLLKGYEGMKAREKTIPKGGEIRITEALDRLIDLYTATNKPVEAKRYKELRDKYTTPKELAPPFREKK